MRSLSSLSLHACTREIQLHGHGLLHVRVSVRRHGQLSQAALLAELLVLVSGCLLRIQVKRAIEQALHTFIALLSPLRKQLLNIKVLC